MLIDPMTGEMQGNEMPMDPSMMGQIAPSLMSGINGESESDADELGYDAAGIPIGQDPLSRVVPMSENLLRLKLSESEMEDLGRVLVQKVEHSITALNERYDLIRMWREMYDARSFNDDWPWEGAANIVVPIVQSILDTIHARALRVCRGVKPWFNITPSKSEHEEAASRIGLALQWMLDQEMSYGDKIDTILRIALESGNCIVKVVWKQEVGTTMDVVPIDEELLKRLALSGETPDTIEAIRRGWEAGTIKTVPIEEDRLKKDAPELVIIDPLDFVVYPVNAKSLDTSILHGHRIWLTKDDILVGIDSGEYDKKAAMALLELEPSANQTSESSGADTVRLEDNGISSSVHLDEEDLPYECFELLAKYQVKPGRPAVWCVFTVERNSNKIIKAIRYPYWHQESCYHNYCPYPIPGQIWGRSIPDILRHLSTEIDSIRNARVNAGTLALTPIFTARRGSLLNTSGIEWSPGQIIQVDDPDSIKPLVMQPPSQSAFAEESAAQREAERVTGASDVSQGIQSKSGRTLGETQAVLSEGNLKFDTIIYRLQSTGENVASQTIALMRQYMSEEVEEKLTDSPDLEFMTLLPSDFGIKHKLSAHGNSLNSNPELDAQLAEKVLMMVERLPWSKPTNLWNAAKKLLSKSGERNISLYLGSQEDVQEFEKSQSSSAPPPTKVSVSAKLDPMASLAVAAQTNPGIMDTLQQLSQGGAPQQMPPGQDPAAMGMDPSMMQPPIEQPDMAQLPMIGQGQ